MLQIWDDIYLLTSKIFGILHWIKNKRMKIVKCFLWWEHCIYKEGHIPVRFPDLSRCFWRSIISLSDDMVMYTIVLSANIRTVDLFPSGMSLIPEDVHEKWRHVDRSMWHHRFYIDVGWAVTIYYDNLEPIWYEACNPVVAVTLDFVVCDCVLWDYGLLYRMPWKSPWWGCCYQSS